MSEPFKCPKCVDSSGMSYTMVVRMHMNTFFEGGESEWAGREEVIHVDKRGRCHQCNAGIPLDTVEEHFRKQRDNELETN